MRCPVWEVILAYMRCFVFLPCMHFVLIDGFANSVYLRWIAPATRKPGGHQFTFSRLLNYNQ